MDECLDMQTTGLNYGQIFFMTLGFLPVLMCFPCWLVAKFIHEPMAIEYKNRHKLWIEEMKKPPPYEERYPVKELEGESSKKTKMNNLVLDKTPDGYVAMRYNADEEGFEYWCDKNVTYKYLETVARKYVNSFGCPEVYINRGKLLREKLIKLQEEIKKNIEDEKNKKDGEEENESKEDEEDNVFADLKKYNSSSKRTSELKKRITKSDIVCDEANKYIKRGKFSDNKSWMKPKDSVKTGSSTWSWLDWKNSQKSD